MKLTYIQMHGFRGFRDLTRVDIPPGFAIIFGPNGVGKSTLCEALLHEDPAGVGRRGPHFSGPSTGATLQG